MKKILALAVLIALPSISNAQTWVNGYYRSDGTYVSGHYRSSPDGSYNNNWSVSPNVNPYTGQRGTLAPTYNNRAPSSNSFGSGLNSLGSMPSFGGGGFGLPPRGNSGLGNW